MTTIWNRAVLLAAVGAGALLWTYMSGAFAPPSFESAKLPKYEVFPQSRFEEGHSIYTAMKIDRVQRKVYFCKVARYSRVNTKTNASYDEKEGWCRDQGLPADVDISISQVVAPYSTPNKATSTGDALWILNQDTGELQACGETLRARQDAPTGIGCIKPVYQ